MVSSSEVSGDTASAPHRVQDATRPSPNRPGLVSSCCKTPYMLFSAGPDPVQNHRNHCRVCGVGRMHRSAMGPQSGGLHCPLSTSLDQPHKLLEMKAVPEAGLHLKTSAFGNIPNSSRNHNLVPGHPISTHSGGARGWALTEMGGTGLWGLCVTFHLYPCPIDASGPLLPCK